MAIDIEWQVKPPTKKGETNQPQLFPRIVNADVVGDAELADKIAAHSGLSRGVVTNVLEDLADVLATMMHEGKEVCQEKAKAERIHKRMGRLLSSCQYEASLACNRRMAKA